jgi:two-component system NtrC family sensor kinase
MTNTQASLLLVDDDRELTRVIAANAALRGYRCRSATSRAEALAALEDEAFDAAVIDPGPGFESGLDVIPRIKELAPDAEIVVMSATNSLASAIKSYEMAAFAFVQKPFDIGQLLATVERALERRRMNLHNRRLVWELQTINDVAESISRSLDMEDVLTGALQRVIHALDAAGGSIRLRDEQTGAYEVRAAMGPPLIQNLWTDLGTPLQRPSDQVIATRAVVLIEDLATLVPPATAAALPVRSGISVPMIVGEELVGTLTIGSRLAYRFQVADQRLLAIVARQIGVAAQNARLHDVVLRGKRAWEETFDAISDPIAVYDSTGTLLRGNRALAAHLGRPITQIRGAACREIGFCGDGCPVCTVGRAVPDEGRRSEITLPDGQIFSVTTFPVGSRGPDASRGVVQVAKNVTEEMRSARRLRQMSEEVALANARLVAAVEQLKSTQAQLLQAEKLSAIGQLVAGVAHELNNPLTSVIGYAQLLEEEIVGSRGNEARPPAELALDLRRIAEESERAARIVRNLLAFARRQTAERVTQNLADLFARVLALRTYEMHLNTIELVTEFEPVLPNVVADGGQIQQALLNLVLNAERAMRGRAVRRLIVGARYDADAAAVELSVSDSGHGIESGNLTRIFDPFFTTREVGEGTGLGLSICYGIVRDHGGQIQVESKLQAGTRFSILLPACQAGASAMPETLIAHADPGQREYLTAALTAWGYRVATTANSVDALARYSQGRLHAILADRDVVAADLPAWRAARTADGGRVPLVLISMAADEGDVEQFGREEGCTVLTPPFHLRALRRAVPSGLESAPAVAGDVVEECV